MRRTLRRRRHDRCEGGCEFRSSGLAVLRGVEKHLDEVIVEGVVKLALEVPGKLRVIEIASVDLEDVGVHRDGGVFQVDEDFDEVVGFAGGELQERVVVETEMFADFG